MRRRAFPARSRSKRSATTSPCTARRAITASPCCPSRRSRTSAAACPATTATITPAIIEAVVSAPAAPSASPRSICPTAIRPEPTNSPTSSTGWSGSTATRASCWRSRSRWCWPATTTSSRQPSDADDPPAWMGDALFQPRDAAARFARCSMARPHRRLPRQRRHAAALHLLGLSGRRLAAEQRHPHRSSAAVAAGRRPAGGCAIDSDVRGATSRPTTCRCGRTENRELSEGSTAMLSS